MVLRVLVTLLLFALAALPAWLRGGTPPALQGPLPWLGGLLLLLIGVYPNGRSSNGVDACRRRPAALQWLNDPFFYMGLLFLGLLALQWRYAGRFLFFDPVLEDWIYSAPLRPGWPFAFRRPEAAEMLRWFFPAWCVGLALRSCVLERERVVDLLRLLVVNAAVIGALGIVQQQTGFRLFPFTAGLPASLRYFASFGYENHAASYFVLMAALAAGLAMRDLGQIKRHRTRPRMGVGMGAACAVNLLAAQFSFSRAGILLSWLLMIVIVVWFARRHYPKMHPVARVNALSAAAATLIVAVILLMQFGNVQFKREVHSLFSVGRESAAQTSLSPTLGVRVGMHRAAFAIFRQAPYFGVGGWGYRYLLPYSQPDTDWMWTQRFGGANVHNDPVQFLVEFGLIGGLLLTGAVAALLVPLFRRKTSGKRRVYDDPLLFFALVGATLVLLHSMVDLPFRSPAILIAWVATLAGAGGRGKRVYEGRGQGAGGRRQETGDRGQPDGSEK